MDELKLAHALAASGPCDAAISRYVIVQFFPTMCPGLGPVLRLRHSYESNLKAIIQGTVSVMARMTIVTAIGGLEPSPPRVDRCADAPNSGRRVLECHCNRRSFAISVLTVRDEHVRKLGVDRAVSTMSGREEPRVFTPDRHAGELREV